MKYLFPILGAAIALAGADKLFGDRGYDGMFRHLGWTRDEMQALAAAEAAGGLLMASRATRRLGGALVAGASAAVLGSELRHDDSGLAASRALVLLAAVLALLMPGQARRPRTA